MDDNRNQGLAAAMIALCKRDGQVQVYKIEEKILAGEAGQGLAADIVLGTNCTGGILGEFFRDREGYLYRDVSKKGNTYYNGCPIGCGELENRDTVSLHEGDILRVVGQAADGGECREVMIFYRHFHPEVSFKMAKLTDQGQQFLISRHEEAKNGDELQPSSGTGIPGHYASVLYADGSWCVEDHNTRLGVFLNSRKIEARMPLMDMDVIRIGNTMFIYRGETLLFDHRGMASNALSIHIAERDVWNFFRRKILLEDINMTIYPGELVLILGGSGAGKTTFINAVMGYEKAEGEILAGDVDVYKNYNLMKYEIGFVPQQDLLRLEDDVYDTLDNAAALKLPREYTQEQRESRIQEVMEVFGLEREGGLLVSKLSGGQRKRLSIAVEYIADPGLFFLDEPDSGLDGVMARSLMENLRRIADEKKIVLVITHSPDRVADLFDKVIVLAKDSKDDAGHLAFYGGIDEAKVFFETDSLEGIVRRLNRNDEGGDGMADEFIRRYGEIERR